jgi:hypothetical protein
MEHMYVETLEVNVIMEEKIIVVKDFVGNVWGKWNLTRKRIIGLENVMIIVNMYHLMDK